MLSWLFSLFSVMFSVWSYVVMCQHSSSLNTQKVCTCWHLSICTLVRVLIFSYSVPVFFLAQIFASNWQNSKQTKQTNNSTVNKQTKKKWKGKKIYFQGQSLWSGDTWLWSLPDFASAAYRHLHGKPVSSVCCCHLLQGPIHPLKNLPEPDVLNYSKKAVLQ